MVCRKILDVTISKIREARAGDEQELVEMQALLWPGAPTEELGEEAEAMVSQRSSGTLPCKMLVSEDGAGALTGFLLVGLRSHADGCDPVKPAGFIEGWFVRADYRGRGIGRQLFEAAEAWARAQGCIEMASDCLIDNHPAHDVHRALGFEVVDRCVHFKKTL